MVHAHRPVPPAAAPPSPRARALIGVAVRVTYSYLLGGGVSYLALTALSRDIGLMFAGALLVLYGAALSKAVQSQGQTAMRGADGTP